MATSERAGKLVDGPITAGEQTTFGDAPDRELPLRSTNHSLGLGFLRTCKTAKAWTATFVSPEKGRRQKRYFDFGCF
jgi:hypothetical protein